MANFHFIQDPSVLEIINGILAIAGPNFAPPFTGEIQPYDGKEANQESLLQFQLPGGSQLQGFAEPSNTGSIGTAINTLLGAFAPFFSAYSLILPILGVIRGIIEILCALLNPFAVIKAIIRLFTKWIPPFISLFPPFAGVVLIISIIKLILAIVFYMLVVIIPTIQLIIDCFSKIADFLRNDLPEELSEQQREAIRAKVESITFTLLQKFGILGSMLPILELVFVILDLVSGFPCSSDNTDRNNTSILSVLPATFPAGDDQTCCDEFCPEILSNRDQQPSGTGILVQSFYGDCAPGFVYNLFTGNSDVAELEQYQESFEEQLNCQVDEPVNRARPAGATQDRALIKVKLTSRRGESRSITVPVLDINDTVVKVTSPLASLFEGTVNYVIEPDYDMLVMSNIIGVGCHPDVKIVTAEIERRFDGIDTAVSEKLPETATLLEDTTNLNDTINNLVSVDLQDCIDSAFSRTNANNIQNDIDCANNVQTNLVDTLSNFADDLSNRLNGILDKTYDTNTSALTVNKNRVSANNEDFAVITVTPRDVTGTSIIRNLPNDVGLDVDILTTFGEITNQQVNNNEGTVTAEIRSVIAGPAEITAKVNGSLLVNRDLNGNVTANTVAVTFIQEADLPARRRRSKPSVGTAISTGVSSDKEPGGK